MLVSCSACSAKFQLPDDKIAGRKARMKCKTCGAPIAIDGTSLRPPGASAAPPLPPSRRPGAAPPTESLSFNDQTVALGAEEAEALSQHARRIDAAVPTDLEDRITPVSNPRAANLLDDSYVDAALDALEQKVFSVPAPAQPAPSAAGKPTPSKPSTAGSATGKAEPKPSGPKKAELPASRVAKPAEPPAPLPKKPEVPPPRVATPAEDEEATRMMDLPRLLSGAPAASAPTSGKPSADSDGDEATRMMDLASSGLSPTLAADEATRIFDPDPAPRAPRLPPRPSLPGKAHAAPAPEAPATESKKSDTGSLSSGAPPAAASTGTTDRPTAPTVLTGGTPSLPAPPSPFQLSPLDAAGRPAPSSPTGSHTPPGGRIHRPPADLTVQRSRVSPVPASGNRSNWGLYLFVLALAATGTLICVYFFARPTFDRAIASTRSALGLGASATAGPAFDAEAASAELARVASRASTCREPGGPTGAGRARVLFQTSGVASSAAISAPFHKSPSEACLLSLFKSARVPPFGGDHPIIATKTFRVD